MFGLIKRCSVLGEMENNRLVVVVMVERETHFYFFLPPPICPPQEMAIAFHAFVALDGGVCLCSIFLSTRKC